jgi:hypothetical protein
LSISDYVIREGIAIRAILAHSQPNFVQVLYMMRLKSHNSGTIARSLIALFAFLCVAAFFLSHSGLSLSFPNRKMGIVHIVLFEFKPEAKPEDVLDVSIARESLGLSFADLSTGLPSDGRSTT